MKQTKQVEQILRENTELKVMNWIDRYAEVPMQEATELEQELLSIVAKIEQEAYDRGRSDCPCLNKYKKGDK